MKVWLLTELRGVNSLHLQEVDEPVPGAGEVRLDVRFAALNPADRFLAENEYPAVPPLPHVLGRDGVGVIDQVGEGARRWKPGDIGVLLRGEVGVTRWGTFAQKVVVPQEYLVPMPAGWTEQQAAGAPLVYLTAYQALMQWGKFHAGAVALVTGASGGVGIAAIQLGRAMGLRMLGLSRGPARAEGLVKLGAERVFDPTEHDWTAQLKSYLQGQRVDLAIDAVAGNVLPGVIEVMGNHGKISALGRSGGAVPQFNTGSLFFRRLRIGGVAAGAYIAEESQRAWSEIVPLLASSGSRPVIDNIFVFEDLVEAFLRLEGNHMGKVLIAVSETARQSVAEADQRSTP